MKRLSSIFIILGLLTVASNPVGAQNSAGLNYNNADLRVFLQDVAMETGLTFVIDPKVNGRVNIISDALVTRATLIELM